jgi:SAM-dependent methyltransferase
MTQRAEPPVAPGYSALPHVYDRWQRSYGKDYTSLVFPRLRTSLRALRLSPGSMLDLACGTGSLAVLMARAGWRVTGIDASAGMVAEARLKAQRAGLNIHFSCQDMRSFRLEGKVDLVTSMFDSLNHLLSLRDLRRAFRSVRRSLRPDGFFIFDLNNERCYRHHWRGSSAMHGEDFSVVLESTYDQGRKLGSIEVTVFDREGGGFRRGRETVRERYYPRAEVQEALKASGFYKIRAKEFNFTPHPEFGTLKTWWVAQAR